ncbi:Crp/Fnr family transcriptional regulator [Pseudomonas akapageensis]|uniref:Crp/Fnr family transcriptional regulator n=1 Tax=Pseudomonas akapageensis TaxID=2609961 RepID=UPI001407A76B|nr:Crp/Fnr family transcriptional regulator [Pseudomonas akapageensis]
MIGFNWIDDLSPFTRDAMREKSRLRSCPGGTTLYQQGDPVIEVFQIVSGEVRQCIITADGQEVLIYIYKPGDVIGDSSIGDEEPYSVTYITRGESVLRVWTARDFSALRATHREVESAVAAQISRRLRGALRIVEELLTQPVAARVASRFLWLAEMQRASKGAVSLTLSQSDIGLMVGSTRPNVNRVMKELRELSLIETDYGKVVVRDVEGLRHYINDHRRRSRDDFDDK